MLRQLLIAPFTEFEFMRRALAGVLSLAIGAGPIGVFLMLRRMSLVGDAIAHAILLIAANATVTLLTLALIYRPLVMECVDPGFIRSVSRSGAPAHLAFLALVVLTLVSGFHALGTLLAVGIMMLPAATARFWARDITAMILISAAAGAISGYAGLLLSYHGGRRPA